MAENISVNIIVAVGQEVPGKGYPIGKGGQLPWHNSNDLKWFKKMTVGHPVITGRKTFESIGKPLPDRMNIIVTRNEKLDAWEDNDSVRVEHSLEDAIALAKTFGEDVFIIGGESIYKEALESNLVDIVHMDMLSERVEDADAFFPYLTGGSWSCNGETEEIEKGKAYAVKYVKHHGLDNEVDTEYFNLVRKVLYHGSRKQTRAGETRSMFGAQVRFDLMKGLPVLTTKKMYFKGIIHELLWFLKGDTNIKYLVDNNVNIWTDDAYRHYLDVVKSTNSLKYHGERHTEENALTKEEFIRAVKAESKLDYDSSLDVALGMIRDYYEDSYFSDNRDWDEVNYRFGDLGPVYGEQWRNWNGIDQIRRVIETLKENPDDRRLIVSAWNVGELSEMALPPCHYSFQFFSEEMNDSERHHWCEENGVTDMYDEDGCFKDIVPSRKLSCMFNMRSCDLGLGWGFNITSYSILTYMVSQCVGMAPGEVIFNGGDVHIYENHVPYLLEQLERDPNLYALPKLKLNPDKKDIDEFTYDDFEIVGYRSYPSIKMPLSVGL